MKRSILVTICSKPDGTLTELYGRVDAKTLFRNGLRLEKTEKRVYQISDTELAKYGHVWTPQR